MFLWAFCFELGQLRIPYVLLMPNDNMNTGRPLYLMILLSWCTEPEDEEKDQDISYELIKEKIDKVNEEVAKLDKKIVIILDALNQVNLSWFSNRNCDKDLCGYNLCNFKKFQGVHCCLEFSITYYS